MLYSIITNQPRIHIYANIDVEYMFVNVQSATQVNKWILIVV